MCTRGNYAKLNRMLSSLLLGFSAIRRRSQGTTPEQMQRNAAGNIIMMFKQLHAMQRARAAGADPYTAIAQQVADTPASMLDTEMPPGKAAYEYEEDYVPGEGYYTRPGEMPAGLPASLTPAQLVEVPGPGWARAAPELPDVCINGRYYKAAAQPAAHQSSAEGWAAPS